MSKEKRTNDPNKNVNKRFGLPVQDIPKALSEKGKEKLKANSSSKKKKN